MLHNLERNDHVKRIALERQLTTTIKINTISQIVLRVPKLIVVFNPDIFGRRWEAFFIGLGSTTKIQNITRNSRTFGTAKF
jgi:hypothetical protein